MANIFVDTERTETGDGSFDSPYNYFDPIMLSDNNVVYITDDSTLTSFELNMDLYGGGTIIGYPANIDPIVTINFQSQGFVIDADNEDYCIVATPETYSGPVVTIKNARLYNWKVEPVNFKEMFDLQQVQASSPGNRYIPGWKYISLKGK